MRIAFGAETDNAVSQAVKARLEELGHEVTVLDGASGWAGIGLAVGRDVATGRADRGVAFCGNGVGVTMGANKVIGARAALCGTPQVASDARRFTDANVLTLGLETVAPGTAAQIAEVFMTTESDSPETDQIEALNSR
jgi:ribose 5-phosphate isomerase B